MDDKRSRGFQDGERALTSRSVVALCAAAALITLDYILAAVAYLFIPPGEWLFVVWLFALIAGIAYRQRWLIFVVQSVITILLTYRMVQSFQTEGIQTSGSEIGSLLFISALLVLGYVFAWLIARALPGRPWFSRPKDDPAIGS